MKRSLNELLRNIKYPSTETIQEIVLKSVKNDLEIKNIDPEYFINKIAVQVSKSK